MRRKNVTLQIQQKGDIILTNGETIPSSATIYQNDPQVNKDINLIVDDFTQEKYQISADQYVDYNIYVPKSVKTTKKDDKKYPLLLFMHDGSIQCNDTRMTLFQGVGATVWASKEEQEIRESFFVAPCFTTVIVGDNWKTSGQYPLIIPMLHSIINKYEKYIDVNRIYTTGQSMGAMTSISLMCEYRDFFASAMIVAGQWNETVMLNMVNDTFWILCSEADPKSPIQNDIAMELLEEHGAQVSRARWDGRADDEEKAENVAKILAEGKKIKYVKFYNGTVMPDDVPAIPMNEHMYTWKVAYLIDGVRKWLFEQRRN